MLQPDCQSKLAWPIVFQILTNCNSRYWRLFHSFQLGGQIYQTARTTFLIHKERNITINVSQTSTIIEAGIGYHE